jgi:hypothetical protein
MNGLSFQVNSCVTHTMVVTTHAGEHWFEVIMDGVFHLGGRCSMKGPSMLTLPSRTERPPELPLTDDASTAPQPTH